MDTVYIICLAPLVIFIGIFLYLTVVRKNTFEENLEHLDKIIESLESGELSLDDAIKEYENAMKLIKSSSKILNEAEGKLLKVIEKNGEIDIEEI